MNKIIFMIVLLTSISSFSAEEEVTYTHLKKHVFKVCYFCHAGRYPHIDRYSDIIKVVTPGDLKNSKLYQYVKSGRMPKSPARLSPEDVELIGKWIMAGAKNN